MNEGDLQIFIGKKIKENRNKLKLTQKELGEKIGVEHNTISAYERGAISLDSNTLFAIGNALSVKVDDLFPPMETEISYLEKTKDMTKENLNATDMLFLQKIIEKTMSMTDEEREKFLASIRFTVDYYEKMNE